MEQILLCRKEAARALGLGCGKLDQLISHGAIRVCRIGRRVLIPCEELKRFAHGRLERTGKSKGQQ
jgi:excisionase family DNA binding protein